jgi:two-component sensor histidine kinase
LINFDGDEPYTFKKDHIDKLEAFVSAAGVALENARLFENAEKELREREEGEQRLKNTLEEKDYLMKELNHRVKNNLAMISSLINLKDSSLGPQVDLSDISRQIDAIRIVHEKLYQGEEITHIDLREYIQELLSTVFSFSRRKVVIENDIEHISIQTRTAIPIGLIVNEIATNAIKHGFTEEEARFTVDIKENASGNRFVMKLSNTGNPFPEDIDLDNPNTLGLQLISNLVEQLEGTVELQHKPITKFIIRLPAK